MRRLVLATLAIAACTGATDAGGTSSTGPEVETIRAEIASLRMSIDEQTTDVDVEDTRIRNIRQQQADDLAVMAELEPMLARVAVDWEDVAATYRSAAASYEIASRSYEDAKVSLADTSAAYEQARARWERAALAWKVAALSIAAAHALETHRLHNRAIARTAESRMVQCTDGMSTRAYRRAMNVPAGMDVDHIVPRSLGGADHPANHQILTQAANRSLGNTFDSSKCAGSGLVRCMAAVAVSQKCGTYTGGLPTR